MDTLRNSLEATGTPKLWLVVSSILLIIAFTARKALHVEYDAREPPIIPQSIPYVGHLISIARYGSSYYAMINKKYNYPIYTLPTWTSRTYIITSPALAAIIQRASPKTSFYSAILEVTKRMVAFDTQSMEIVQSNANREAGDEGVMPESHDMLASTLEPGPTLNRITTLQLEIFSLTLDKVRPQGKEVVELHSWLREQFTLANATAIYGPENLFSMNASLINDFWAFEAGIVSLIANILPRITARKAYFARERVMSGLIEYVELERYKKASSMIQKRIAINLKHGLSKKMVGHGELVMLFAILGNAIPTTFWFLAHLFSQPELLADVRSEIGAAVTVNERGIGEDGEKKIIHVEKLKSVAPILISAYRETLRFVANLSSVRMILEDTVIGGKYLLKKDSIVQIASGVIHLDPDVWGPDAAEFNARRFLQTNTSEDVTGKTTTAPLPKNVPSAAFRAFGGGSVICPGRHFAQSEIVGFVAAVVMGFDFENPSGGVIELPERNDGLLPLVVMKPKRECMVAIKRRKGLEKVRWELEL